jgi:hypothetical protein
MKPATLGRRRRSRLSPPEPVKGKERARRVRTVASLFLPRPTAAPFPPQRSQPRGDRPVRRVQDSDLLRNDLGDVRQVRLVPTVPTTQRRIGVDRRRHHAGALPGCDRQVSAGACAGPPLGIPRRPVALPRQASPFRVEPSAAQPTCGAQDVKSTRPGTIPIAREDVRTTPVSRSEPPSRTCANYETDVMRRRTRSRRSGHFRAPASHNRPVVRQPCGHARRFCPSSDPPLPQLRFASLCRREIVAAASGAGVRPGANRSHLSHRANPHSQPVRPAGSHRLAAGRPCGAAVRSARGRRARSRRP